MINSNPLLSIKDLPDFNLIEPAHIEPAIKTLIENAQSVLETVTKDDTVASWDTVVIPLENALDDLGLAWGIVGHLQSVVDTPALRDAYNEALPLVTSFYLALSQSEVLFKKYQAIKANEFSSLNAIRQRILNRELRDFELSGAALPGEKKAQVKAIGETLSQRSQKFSENLLDATNAYEYFTKDVSELDGIPEDSLELFKAQAQGQGKEGYRITLHFPSYLPVMQYANNRALRERIYKAFSTRAAEFDGAKFNNLPFIEEILDLRQQEASLLGFKNYAEVSLSTKMAESPDEVLSFLGELAQRAKPFAEKDMNELREFAKTLGLTDLASWDLAWVSEKLRESRYAYSDQTVKAYFTEPTVFAGLFALVEKLFGIQIEEKSAPTWHESVKYFEISKDQKVIASFYADLYAREGKRSGAWMDSLRSRKIKNGELQTPMSYLVCNFAPGTNGKPATLTHDDVTTLFHEFGHSIHHLLTAQTEGAVSGINGVEWDAVELPSQFLENFAWEWEVVEKLTHHVETGEKLPKALFEKMLKAKNFQSGMACVRQLEFALFDMRLHATFDVKTQKVYDLLKDVRQEVAVNFPPEYNRFPNSFSHIFSGGYAAGYYSYKWAEVLSADAYSLFEETGVLNEKTGLKYLKEILEAGSSRDAIDNFVAFRGRKPSLDALLRHSGMTK